MLFLAACVVSLGFANDEADPLRSGFANPGREFRPLPMGMRKRGNASAVEISQALADGRWGGLNEAFPRGFKYLQDPAGWERFKRTIDSLKERGLTVWIYDERGYPSGRAGGQVLAGHPEFEARGLFYAATDVKAGEGQMQARADWRLPEGEPFYIAAYPLTGNSLDTLAQPVDLTSSASGGWLRVTLPECKSGAWRLMAFVRNRLFQGTHAAKTGGPYLNVLDPGAVRRFIEITHQAYYSHGGQNFGRTIAAVFNDEVSLMNGFLSDEPQPHPAVAWYGGLPALFKQRHGYDIRACLPALFNDLGVDTARMRCDFYSTVSHQIADAFFKQIRQWCAAHHVASTGHLLWEESLIYHANFYGSVFPSYKELDWPGIDVLGSRYGHTNGAATDGGPVPPKLASSAAHLWGRARTMSESFCFVTHKTPIEDLMAHYGWQAVLGINALTTLSIQDAYSAEELGRFNDYVGRLNFMLTQGRFTADVAILYPIASVWADFVPTNRHVRHLEDHPKAKVVDDAWRTASLAALACQRDFDYLDEEAIRDAIVKEGKLQLGLNSYSTLVLPHVTTLSLETLRKIRQFVDDGGAVISWQTIPGNRADPGKPGEFQALAQEIWNGRNGRVIHAVTEAELNSALRSVGAPDLVVTPATADVYYQHRLLPRGDLYFLLNNAQVPVSGDFALRAQGKAELWDPVTGGISSLSTLTNAKTTMVRLTIPARRGLFVVFSRN